MNVMKRLSLTAALAGTLSAAASACDDPLPAGNLVSVSSDVRLVLTTLKTPEEAVELFPGMTKEEILKIPLEAQKEALRISRQERADYAATRIHLGRLTYKCPSDMVLADGHTVRYGRVAIINPSGERLTFTNANWHLLEHGQAAAGVEEALRRVLDLER